jgi:uncharacterized protein (DUF1800 family)
VNNEQNGRGGRYKVLWLATAAALTLAACGGGGGSGGGSGGGTGTTPPSAPPVSKAEAYRFLNQSTLGATEAEAQRLIGLGDSTNAYGRWIDAEIAKPASTLLPYVEAAYATLSTQQNFFPAQLNAPRLEKWFENVLRGDDQLRQRVAFALSQIMVVSQVGALQNLGFATADFYDMLARNAFGDFRQLLEDVTLHPAMGVYLSMLGNQKAVAGTNLRPDENYARELMQLFSVGLVELNPDGSTRLDAQGQPIPTYDQAIIEGFARVFTGWTWQCPTTNPGCSFASARPQLAPVAGYNQIRPMRFYPEQHETGAKQLLRYSGVTLPNGVLAATATPTAQDLEAALDNIFNHPNVGPFIAKQLIQKLVTSNPSPGYVQRVATRFNNDGSGRRGNMAAVVRAVLLDTEARSAPSGDSAGKLKEPLLRLTQFWRTYDARSASGRYGVQAGNFPGGVSTIFGQGPGQSPSVFNFFSPFYAPPGEISNANLVAPELQLATEYLNTQVTNFFWTQAIARTTAQTNLGADVMFIDTRAEQAVVADSAALLDRVAERLLGGASQLSATLRTEARAQIDRTPAGTAAGNNLRVADAIYFVVTSPEFALQR